MLNVGKVQCRQQSLYVGTSLLMVVKSSLNMLQKRKEFGPLPLV